jgi:ribosomal protein S18 acetylase RimI-like enzyme
MHHFEKRPVNMPKKSLLIIFSLLNKHSLNMNLQFRTSLFKTDLPAVRNICTSTGFFREDEIDVAVELVQEALDTGQEKSGYYFLFAMDDESTCGFVCFGPTPCTIGTFDLYWIVVDDNYRGKGVGLELLRQTENMLKQLKARKLYIETSSTDKYLPTRKFYQKAGYTEEARLKDFYLPGDDKVIYSGIIQKE